MLGRSRKPPGDDCKLLNPFITAWSQTFILDVSKPDIGPFVSPSYLASGHNRNMSGACNVFVFKIYSSLLPDEHSYQARQV